MALPLLRRNWYKFYEKRLQRLAPHCRSITKNAKTMKMEGPLLHAIETKDKAKDG